MARVADAKTKSFMIESKPYVKKQNLVADKAQWVCWEVHLRTMLHDIYVTVCRRKFIPPLMDIFQDIICISQTDIKLDEDIDPSGKKYDMLTHVHRPAIDSLHSLGKTNTIYRNIVEEKVNALLMDEEMMNYYHFNHGITPSGISYAANYLKSMFGILGRYNGEIAKELWGMLRAQNLMSKHEHLELPPAEIVE